MQKSTYLTAVPAVSAATAAGIMAVTGVAGFNFDRAPPSDGEVIERGLVDKTIGGRCNVETARKLSIRVSSDDEGSIHGWQSDLRERQRQPR